jgi:hypothetical protein
MSLDEVQLRPGALRLRSAEGYVDVFHARHKVALLGFHGTAQVEITDSVFHELDAILTRDGQIDLFTDLSSVVDYDTAFRERFTWWFRKNRDSIKAVHALVTSSLVLMGIGIANLALGGLIRPYRQPAEFEKQLMAFSARDSR